MVKENELLKVVVPGDRVVVRVGELAVPCVVNTVGTGWFWVVPKDPTLAGLFSGGGCTLSKVTGRELGNPTGACSIELVWLDGWRLATWSEEEPGRARVGLLAKAKSLPLDLLPDSRLLELLSWFDQAAGDEAEAKDMTGVMSKA